MDELVKLDQHVLVQRDNFIKIHKLTSKNMDVRLGQDTVNIEFAIGKPFWSMYKMIRKGSKRSFSLTDVEDNISTDKILALSTSGADNRNIFDDGSSQKLSTTEINNMRTSGISSDKIVETIVENSKTFASKTEYSQEKYLKKKEKKYQDTIIVKKPNFRTVAESILSKSRPVGLRMDTLAQLTTLACVRSGGCYMVYETGCQGLITAAVLNAIGEEGSIIHVHNGNNPEKQALQFLDFPSERMDQIMCVSIFHLLRKLSSSNGVMDSNEPPKKKARWEEREEKAIGFLKNEKVDGLLVVSKEDPSNIVRKLVKYLHPARPFATFSGTREPLLDLFLQLKTESDVTALRLTESWLRTHQVLPDRTHPDINMSGSGGCLLSGFKICS